MSKFYAATTPEVSEREVKHGNLVRTLAGECMVLLENDKTLPIKLEHKKIALYGNGARHTVKGGTGSGDVNVRESVSIEAGLEAAGAVITTDNWLNRYTAVREDAKIKYMEKLAQMEKATHKPVFALTMEVPFEEPELPEVTQEDLKASDTDTAIFVIARNSGEGSDRLCKKGDYLLSDSEKAALATVAGSYPTCIVLLNVGGIIDTTWLKENADIKALLLVGQAGNMGGHIIADVLSGKTVPSGKLSDTWAKDYADYPSSKTFSHNNGNVDEEYYEEDIYVGYRYFDTFQIKPNYCFGYGLSYTEFAMKVEDVILEKEDIAVSVVVANIGKEYAGREVVQVYYSAPDGELNKPYQELVAFAKTGLLQPGESQQIKLIFKASVMASYSEKEEAWIMEPGEYLLRVGNSSRNNNVCASLVLDGKAVTSKVRNLFPDKERDAWKALSGKAGRNENNGEIRKIQLEINDIVFGEAEYSQPNQPLPNTVSDRVITAWDVINNKASVEELVAQLTAEEMAKLCVGTANYDTSVIGVASAVVPGAAGDTTSALLESRGIENLILADGPAGLRLYPCFATDKEGNVLPGGEIFGEASPGQEVVKSEQVINYYQYCTAIPIATLLAQSWDMDLIKQMGDIIGAEMEEFHIHLWLAPGMNIHRNPLCGRNFEYYSEDPLLTGMCAAAATLGVQSHGGAGTTIKHFAGNNQEENRMFTNAHISERALREIYLKGFEIAVKFSHPMSVMTSYNLINGTHAANHYELLQNVLRDEWGFDGVVMTDWFSSQEISRMFSKYEPVYPIASSALCIKAGNDLQMPGCQQNIDDIIEAVNSGELPIADLQACALRILKIVLACHGAQNGD